jgi:RNA polymerase sigma-70 factor (ECF subfamily)
MSMDERDWLAQRFEEDRGRLRAVAYRMLGSLAEADDAVQEAWLRLARTDADAIKNLSGWLTTVVGRVCLDMLRTRTARREESLDTHVPDPIVTRAESPDPEQEAVLAESVGLALAVVLDTLTPAKRLAVVLHDMFGVPFDDIVTLLERSTDATKMLASRGRRRLRGAAPTPDADVARQQEVVEAFFAAARAGDFESLVAVLAPDVLLRADGGTSRPDLSALVRGSEAVAGRALLFSNPAAVLTPALVNGAAGVVVTVDGQRFSVIGFTVVDSRIAGIDVLADLERLATLELPLPDV